MPLSQSLLTSNVNDIWENTYKCCDILQSVVAFLIDMEKMLDSSWKT